MRNFRRPLLILGILTAAFGVGITFVSLGYLLMLGLIFISIGTLVIFIDIYIGKLVAARWLIHSQVILSVCYLLLMAWWYAEEQENNTIVFPKGFTGEAGIIFGIEGYPALPKTLWWEKTISIPQNGVIITSTLADDIPQRLQYQWSDGSVPNIEDIHWDPGASIDCIASDGQVKAWLFTIGTATNPVARNTMAKLCDDINSKNKRTSYRTEQIPISDGADGKYLWLQGRGLTALPQSLGNTRFKEIILTDNDFQSVPASVLKVQSLERLVMAVNPIDKFPSELSQLPNLKDLSLAATRITKLPDDLSMFSNLEHFDLSRNALTAVSDGVKTIPRVKWLQLHDNKLGDITFIDEKLSGLETLDLYSNLIDSITPNIKSLGELKELNIFDNNIRTIPDHISSLHKLEKLEIWDNPIHTISPQIKSLRQLKHLRLDDDFLSARDKQLLREWLPDCTIYFQTRSKK